MFLKLAKICRDLVEEARRWAPPKTKKATTKAPKAMDAPVPDALASCVTTESSTPLERNKSLSKWQAPLEGATDDGNVTGRVDMLFNKLDAQLVEEAHREAEDSESDDKDEKDLDNELPETVTVVTAAAKTRKQKVTDPLLLMKGEIYDFELVKRALDSVVPQAEVQNVSVVKKGGLGLAATLVQPSLHPFQK
uniref:Uncharacterized protein n=1 Tax=Mycena chlorophos TaxID=658473 RepID=A0ABQ0M2M7_MYCCL|nr:predicted protein [Mycena chlorophos]